MPPIKFEKRSVLNHDVIVFSGPNEPCFRCNKEPARFIQWIDDTTMVWLCKFCEAAVVSGKKYMVSA